MQEGILKQRSVVSLFRIGHFQKGSVFMRKFLSILVVIALTVSFASTVIANPEIPDDDGMVYYNGEYVHNSTLTNDQIHEALGIKAVKERAAFMAALDATASALKIPGIEDLYGDGIDSVFKAQRDNFLSDLAGIIQIYGVNPNMDNPRDYAPRQYFKTVFEYYKQAWLDLGFEEDGLESRCYLSYLPNVNVQPSKRGPNGISTVPFLMVMEMGHKSLPEVTINFCHQDTTNEDLSSSGIGGNHGGYPGALKYIWDLNPNRFWTLGGARQANIVKDPHSDRYVLVGRGTDDDRAMSAVMLYAMKALKDSGVPLRRRVRLLLGQNEESSARWSREGITQRAANVSFWDGEWYVYQDEFPVVATTADSGVTEIMYQPSTSTWAPNISMGWTYGADSIGLRFPNVLNYTDIYSTGQITAAMVEGTSTNPTPAALPNYTYEQTREEFEYKTYYAGDKMTTTNGQNLRLAAWLVMPGGANASELLAAARNVRNSYRVSWGGWEWPDEKAVRPPVQQVLAYDRWDMGIDVQQVNSSTGLISATGDAVQIIAKGYVSRFWEKEFFSPRHILVDFLSKLAIPSGVTAPWQIEFKKLSNFFPFDNFRERKVWNGSTMLGNYTKPIYSGTYAHYASFTPTFSTPLSADSSIIGGKTSWTPKFTPTTPRAYTLQGRNDENVTSLDVGFTFRYGHVPVPDGYLDLTIDARSISDAIKRRAADLGLTQTTTSNASNATGSPYSAWDQDVLLKALNAYNNYYAKFGAPDPGYSGEVKNVRADMIAGGTYAIDFRIAAPGATNIFGFDGRMIATGGWGGRGSLHSYNERVEVDGIIDHGKRTARLFAEWAAGVPHTWTIAGGTAPDTSSFGYKGNSEKGKLAYAASNDVVHGIYLEEESVVNPIIVRLYAMNALDRNETTEILFARKFKVNDAATTGLTLTTKLINADGTDKGAGKVYLLAQELSNPALPPIAGTWKIVNSGTAGSASFKFDANSVYNMLGTTATDVEVAVIALVVTNGSSVPLNLAGDEIEEQGEIKDAIKERIKDNTGCNAGYAFFALLVLPLIRRKK